MIARKKGGKNGGASSSLPSTNRASWSLPLQVLLFFGLVATAHAASAQIVRIWPTYKKAAELERISDYIATKPVDNTRFGSQPKDRDGFYFVTRLESPAAQSGATIELDVIRPSNPKPTTYTYKVDLSKGTHTLYVGLTGADWPDPAIYPVAWRLTFRDSSGAVIAQEKSFLWK